MENVQTRLVEAYSNALNDIRSSREGQAAIAEWEPLVTTRNGEQTLIDAAKHGENSARLFLFIRAIPQLGSALKRFLGENPKIAAARVRNGDDIEFVSDAMEALDYSLGKNSDGNDRYDTSKVTPGKSLMNDFGMWMMNAMKTRGQRTNTASNRGNMTGKITKKDVAPSIGSYDAHIEAGGAEPESKHNPFHDTEALDAWETFIDDETLDAGKTPTARDVLRFFLSRGDFDVNAASAQFGKTNMTIRTKLAGMKEILEDHGITSAVFGQLLTTHGPKGLAETL